MISTGPSREHKVEPCQGRVCGLAQRGRVAAADALAGGTAGPATSTCDILVGMSAKSRRARKKPVRQAPGRVTAPGRLRLPACGRSTTR